MDLLERPTVLAMKAEILRDMTECLEEDEAMYTEADIDACDVILTECLRDLSSSANAQEGLDSVRRAVEKLNHLNKRCRHRLIETLEREAICELFITASALLGFSRADDDITEEWREW